MVKSPPVVKAKPGRKATSSTVIYQGINEDTRDEENVYNLPQPTTSPSATTGIFKPSTKPIPTITTKEPVPVHTAKPPPVDDESAPTPVTKSSVTKDESSHNEKSTPSDYETCRAWYYQSLQKITGTAAGINMLQLPEEVGTSRHSSLTARKLESSVKDVSTPEMQRAAQSSPQLVLPANDELLYEDLEIEEDPTSAQENDEDQQTKETVSNPEDMYM